MKKLTNILFVLLFAGASLVNAQTKDYSGEPGYFNYDKLLNMMGDDAKFAEFIVEEKALEMMGKIQKSSDPKFAALMDGLKLVKANIFEITDKNKPQFENFVDKLAKELMNDGWEQIMSIRAKDMIARIFVKSEGDDNVVGLAGAGVDLSEDEYDDSGKKSSQKAGVFNIVGNIDLEEIGKIGAKFNIPSLNDMDGSDYKNKKDK